MSSGASRCQFPSRMLSRPAPSSFLIACAFFILGDVLARLLPPSDVASRGHFQTAGASSRVKSGSGILARSARCNRARHSSVAASQVFLWRSAARQSLTLRKPNCGLGFRRIGIRIGPLGHSNCQPGLRPNASSHRSKLIACLPDTANQAAAPPRHRDRGKAVGQASLRRPRRTLSETFENPRCVKPPAGSSGCDTSTSFCHPRAALSRAPRLKRARRRGSCGAFRVALHYPARILPSASRWPSPWWEFVWTPTPNTPARATNGHKVVGVASCAVPKLREVSQGCVGAGSH